MTALAHVLLTVLGDLVALGAAAAVPVLLALALRGWVSRDPAGVQTPRGATGLAGADLRAPLPGSSPPSPTPGPAVKDHGPVISTRSPRTIRRGGRALTSVGALPRT